MIQSKGSQREENKDYKTFSYLFTIIFGHDLIQIDSANQIIVKITTRVTNTLCNSLKASEVDDGIKPVVFVKHRRIQFHNIGQITFILDHFQELKHNNKAKQKSRYDIHLSVNPFT